MKIIAYTGNEGVAKVYIGEIDGKYVEFVESFGIENDIPEKWVIIVSTLFGCPVQCKMCDAGGRYYGKIRKEGILSQIDYLVNSRFPDGKINTRKFKIQFARMGDPAFNDDVIDVLIELKEKYGNTNLIPSLSTIAPKGRDGFFNKLLQVKKQFFRTSFQMQFSIHSTDQVYRDWLIPSKKWDFEKIASYGQEFFDEGGKKITLNFAISKRIPLDAECVREFFDPKYFIIKLTPVNPTFSALNNNLCESDEETIHLVAKQFKKLGYDVVVSIGNYEENKIGSNCGMYLRKITQRISNQISYNYPVITLNIEKQES
ncbi:MAG: radical SAM protein [Candidatus Hydrothermia bacterium]